MPTKPPSIPAEWWLSHIPGTWVPNPKNPSPPLLTPTRSGHSTSNQASGLGHEPLQKGPASFTLSHAPKRPPSHGSCHQQSFLKDTTYLLKFKGRRESWEPRGTALSLSLQGRVGRRQRPRRGCAGRVIGSDRHVARGQRQHGGVAPGRSQGSGQPASFPFHSRSSDQRLLLVKPKRGQRPSASPEAGLRVILLGAFLVKETGKGPFRKSQHFPIFSFEDASPAAQEGPLGGVSPAALKTRAGLGR